MPEFGQEPFDAANISKTTRTTQRTDYSDSGTPLSSFTETISDIRGDFSLAEIVGSVLALIALVFAVAMVAGWVPIDATTISIISLTAAMPALGLLVKITNKLRG